jgi:hypothetical protein
MASIRFTPPVSNAFLTEIVPFCAGVVTTFNLLLLWDVDGPTRAFSHASVAASSMDGPHRRFFNISSVSSARAYTAPAIASYPRQVRWRLCRRVTRT